MGDYCNRCGIPHAAGKCLRKESVVRPWDTPGLPPRTQDERCRHHKHCAYRDDDPAICGLCHAGSEKCTCGREFSDD